MTQVKTRFAPSPTGYLHVGSLRTALYAYLFAKKHEGIFVLRIEDTDQKRYVEGSVENLQEILKYYDLTWDEGPYFQSQRTELYIEHADKLLESGHAYRCFCTSERLTEMRQKAERLKRPTKYDRHCLNLSKDEVQEMLNQGQPFVIRQLIPQEPLEFTDQVRGHVSFHGKDVDDQVLVKSDGFPTYHLANVVDDHHMGITHVIRGEEWLPSTPKHIWLYQAFGWTPPEFAHLPLLLNGDKSKLSKRQGDVAAEDYIKKGYLKDAMLNFIAFLGWNPGSEEEFFTLPELIQNFSIDRVQKGGAVFNVEKLDWFNGHYLRKMSTLDLATQILEGCRKEDWFKESPFKDLSEIQLSEGTSDEANSFLRFADSVQSRMKTLLDGPEMMRPYLLGDLNYDEKLFFHEKMKVDRAMAVMALENSIPTLEEQADYNDEAKLKELLVAVIQKLGVKNGQVLWPLRIALTNEQYSPGVFEVLRILGKERSINRLKMALDKLKE